MFYDYFTCSLDVVNASGYSVLERSLINKVLEENRFQMGGLVDDSQIGEIGKRMGANLVFVSSVTTMNQNYYVSFKLIEVETARVEKQQTGITQRGTGDLLQIVNKTASEMLGAATTISPFVRNDSNVGNLPQTNVSGSRGNGEAYNPDGIELIYVERTVGMGRVIIEN